MSGANAVSEELSDVCDFSFVSVARGRQRRQACTYLARFLGHPDEGSEFARKLGNYKLLFRLPIVNHMATSFGLEQLKKKGYDALLAAYESNLIGHTAFQRHEDNTLHVFSVFVQEKYRNNGLAEHMHIELLQEARNRGIDRVRLGAGGHKAMDRLYDNVIKREAELAIRGLPDRWVEIL